MYNTPKVTLLSWTKDPIELIYAVWQASKNEEPLMTTDQVKTLVPAKDVNDLFRAVIAQKIPVGEHVDFVFAFENVSVSWREQAVRHRIGTTASPERVGSDMVHMETIPNLADSSWWSQSMRIQNMGRFADNKAYRMPETVLKHPEQRIRNVYDETMAMIQASYNVLVDAGIPMEDAREVIPLGAQHRMTWRLNIGSLQHIVGKRGCQILQLGIWGPVIEGMIKELVEKVDPIFAELVTPPCITGDKFNSCVYVEENRRRYTQEDKMPPCTLYHRHHSDLNVEETPMGQEMVERGTQYRKFWKRDEYTGVRLKVMP